MVRSPVVGLVDHDGFESSLGEILSNHRAAAAAADNDNIGFYDLRLGARRDLDEGEVEPLSWLAVDRDLRKSDDLAQIRARLCPGLLHEQGQGFEQEADDGDLGVGP
jgi:hypothetical protein